MWPHREHDLNIYFKAPLKKQAKFNKFVQEMRGGNNNTRTSASRILSTNFDYRNLSITLSILYYIFPVFSG